MFKKVTKKLVRQIDPSGILIPASSLNDCQNLQLLAVVLRSKKKWIWQRTKYRPTEFTLNNLLKQKKTLIKPVCERKEMLQYVEKKIIKMDGSAEVGGPTVTLNLNGQYTSKCCVSFETLQKEYVDIPKLLKDSKERKLNVNHTLIKQSLKKNKTFTLLKERIFSPHNCKIAFTEQDKSGCHAMFGGCFTEMSIEGSGKLHHDSETNLDIPPDTVLAYSVMEISIDSDGYFELCLVPSGIKSDDISEFPCPNDTEVDGHCPLIQEGFPLHTQNKALADVQTVFCALADLPPERRSSILILLRKILLDQTVLSALVDTLEDLSSGEAPCFLTKQLCENQSLVVGEFLDLLKCESHEENKLSTSSSLSITNGCQKSPANHSHPPVASDENGCHSAVSNQNGCSKAAGQQSMELMYAMQMLLSALEELTDTRLKLLEPFCTSESLRSLKDLVSVIHLTSYHMPLCKDPIPVFAQSKDDFHRVEELFRSCNVLLKKEDDTLTSEMTCREGFLPLLLCISIYGLASLSAE